MFRDPWLLLQRVLLANLSLELSKLDNKVRFILGVVKGEITVNNRKRAELLDELHRKGFTKFPKKNKNVDGTVAGATPDGEDHEESDEKGYEYLLSMAIGTLTLEKVQELCAQRDKLHDEVEELNKATPESLWLWDLDAFMAQLDVRELPFVVFLSQGEVVILDIDPCRLKLCKKRRMRSTS